jgi:hypothetical protein
MGYLKKEGAVTHKEDVFALHGAQDSGLPCQSGFTTLSSEPLQEQSAVVLLCGRSLAYWLLALSERGGHGDLHGSARLSVIPYIHGRTELYCAQVWLASAIPFSRPFQSSVHPSLL